MAADAARPQPAAPAEPAGGAVPTAALHALGDPTRQRILVLLAGTELAAGDVVAALQAQVPMTQPAVSQHLRVLREAGLVSVRAEGTRRLYAIDPSGVAVVQAWLAAVLDPLAGVVQPLDALETELARGRRARRRTVGRATPTCGEESRGGG